ncbi:MAG: NAD(P)H-dependent oxidoreductase subunit E [Chloroflexota bacterium]
MAILDAELAELLADLPRVRSSVLPALIRVQRARGYLSDVAIEAIAEHLRLTRNDVDGIATGYPELRRAAHRGVLVRVCSGLSCALEGSAALGERLEAQSKALGIHVEQTPCLFSCATAPVVDIGGRCVGRASDARVVAALHAVESRAASTG